MGILYSQKLAFKHTHTQKQKQTKTTTKTKPKQKNPLKTFCFKISVFLAVLANDLTKFLWPDRVKYKITFCLLNNLEKANIFAAMQY